MKLYHQKQYQTLTELCTHYWGCNSSDASLLNLLSFLRRTLNCLCSGDCAATAHLIVFSDPAAESIYVTCDFYVFPWFDVTYMLKMSRFTLKAKEAVLTHFNMDLNFLLT